VCSNIHLKGNKNWKPPVLYRRTDTKVHGASDSFSPRWFWRCLAGERGRLSLLLKKQELESAYKGGLNSVAAENATAIADLARSLDLEVDVVKVVVT